MNALLASNIKWKLRACLGNQDGWLSLSPGKTDFEKHVGIGIIQKRQYTIAIPEPGSNLREYIPCVRFFIHALTNNTRSLTGLLYCDLPHIAVFWRKWHRNEQLRFPFALNSKR